jgi:O-antigen polysaccharide polymerase Wzy
VAFLPIHIVVTVLVAIASVSAIELRLYESPLSHGPIAIATGLTVFGLIAYARYFVRLSWLSASVVYLLLFWMFHFGMTFTAVLFPDVLLEFEDWQLEWFGWPNVRVGMLLGVIGAAGFVFGSGLLTRRPSRNATLRGDTERGLYIGGWLIMLSGIASSWVFVALNVGLTTVFSEGYLSFLALAGSTILGTLMGLANLGCLLAICGARGRDWTKPLAMWGVCQALPVLILGARQGPLIAALGFAVVLSCRGVQFNRAILAVALLAAFVGIPAIAAYRNIGFANRDSVNWTDVTPLDTFTELGGSLQATKAYVDWIERGDPYLLGATYWAPFDRQILTRAIPGREQIPWESDERLPMRLMDEREGPFGGSATGEAYYNFGPLGPFVVLAFVGALFGWLENVALRSASGCVILGVVMFVFFFHIRGDWLPIPASIGQGLIILAGCQFLGHFVLAKGARGIRPAAAERQAQAAARG